MKTDKFWNLPKGATLIVKHDRYGTIGEQVIYQDMELRVGYKTLILKLFITILILISISTLFNYLLLVITIKNIYIYIYLFIIYNY